MSGNGDLPAGWARTTLGDVFVWSSGGTPDTRIAKYYDGDIPWVNSGELDDSLVTQSKNTITQAGLMNSSAKLVKPGSVLIAMYGATIGKLAVAGIPLTTNQAIAFTCPEPIEARYLFYYLLAQRENLAGMGKGAAQRNISQAVIRAFTFLVPPLAEQRRIVAAIEQQFTRLDAGVAALKRAQTALKQYRAAVLKAAVEGKLTEEWRAAHPDAEPASELLARILAERRARWEADLRTKGKDPAKAKYEEPKAPDTASLPQLPEGWCWATVEQVSILVTDGDHNPPKRVPDGTPHLTAKNIADSRLDFEGCTFISEQDVVRVFQRYRPLAGDLIVTCVGTLGRTAIVPEGVVFSPDRNLAGVRTILGTGFTKWLQCCLQSPELQTIMGNISGSTAQPHLYLSDLRSLPIPLPPLVEQEQIVGEVERRLSVVSELEASVAANLKRAERLRQSILERAFSGRLVPQDPTDEPASALLERIRGERRGHTSGQSQSRTQPEPVAPLSLWEVSSRDDP